MSYDTFSVNHSEDGFSLVLEQRSILRDSILSVADWLCKVTGHRGCNSWFDKVYTWAESRPKADAVYLPLDREEADLVSWLQGVPEAWKYLDDWED